jgi:pyruvate dehydrogenase (quinone)
VTILGGAGCRDAHAELVAIADALAAPVVHAMRGKEFIEYDNPFDVGMTGLLGFASGYLALKDCADELPLPGFRMKRRAQMEMERTRSRRLPCEGQRVVERSRRRVGEVQRTQNRLVSCRARFRDVRRSCHDRNAGSARQCLPW